MRRPEIEDADTAHNARVSRINSGDFHPPARTSTSSSIPQEVARSITRNSSIATFARGLSRNIPYMRVFPPPETIPDHQEHHVGQLRNTSVASSYHEKKERKLSFVLPTSRKPSNSADSVSQPNSNIRDFGGDVSSKPPSREASVKGSLRDRRKVNLGLSLPVKVPDLPPRSRSPVTHFNSITPSRPRSPKTPWVRNDQAKWPLATTPATGPIMEEDYMDRAMVDEGNGAIGLLPGDDPIISSYSPKFERPPQKVRDRCYISRPRNRRNRSGRSNHSEDALSHTPDGSCTPSLDPAVTYERPSSTAAELEQLGQTARHARSKRWRWTRSATRSSDGAPQIPITESPVNRRISINPFRRSGRISDQMDQDKDTEAKQSLSAASRL